MRTILLTNDDGVMSPGLWALHEALSEVGDVIVVAPERPRSATSMSLTFHKPLRISRITIEGVQAYVVSGNPADCVSLGVNRILRKKSPSVVVAGINPGDNVSVQVVFASGTVAAAIQAAILGIPAIAFSVVVPEEKAPTRDEYSTRYRDLLKIAKEVVEWALDAGLPRGIDFLNVNFPSEVTVRTPIRFTRLALRKYDDYVVKRVDLRGRPYYWQWGTIKPEREFEVGTDVNAIHGENVISITPLSLNMSATARGDEISKLGNKLRRAGFAVHQK